jgi:hypothetical protein
MWIEEQRLLWHDIFRVLLPNFLTRVRQKWVKTFIDSLKVIFIERGISGVEKHDIRPIYDLFKALFRQGTNGYAPLLI